MRHARHLYQVLVEPPKPASTRRAAGLHDGEQIGVGVHYRGVHLHPYYRKRYGLEPGVPAARHLGPHPEPPAQPGTDRADQDDVVEALLLGVS